MNALNDMISDTLKKHKKNKKPSGGKKAKVEVDNSKKEVSAEGKKAQRSQRRKAKGADAAPDKKSKRTKAKSEKAAKPAKAAKGEKKSKRAAKADKVNGKPFIVKAGKFDLTKAVAKKERPGKLVTTDLNSVNAHFASGLAKEAGRIANTKTISKMLSSAIKDGIGASVKPSVFDSAAKEIANTVVKGMVRTGNKQLKTLHKAARDGALNKSNIDAAVANCVQSA